MTDFLLSPRGANIVSMVFLVLILSIYAFRFGLPEKTRDALLSRFRRKPDSSR